MAKMKTDEFLYAVVGAGDFAIEKVRNVSRFTDKKTTERYYKDFVKRGRALSTSIKSSGPTKRAVAQTKTARTQVRAATSSVSKAAGASAKATKAAAEKAAS